VTTQPANHGRRNQPINMNSTIAPKLATLLEIRIANYRMDGDMHPEFAAQIQMHYTLSVIKGQEKYAEQLIDEHIEDALKYRQQCAA
jgi:hypothetical protein